MTAGAGVRMTVERRPRDVVAIMAPCLFCTERFEVSVVMIAVYAMGERIGVVGPCCLAEDALVEYYRTCREWS
jgi:hypothetical protein